MKTQNQAAYTLADLKAAAYGRWPEIHAALGIDPRYLNPRRHCPCPRCGGKDRYRYTDYQGRGGFICNQCYPEGGSGFDLLMLVFGYDFAEATHQVAAVLGSAGRHAERHTPRPMPAPTPAELQPDYLPAMLSWWEEAFPLADGDPVTGYLKTRGLPLPETLPAALRYEPALPYWAQLSDERHCLICTAAMLAAITTPDGQLKGIHQTYLQHDGAAGWRKLAAKHPETGEALPAKKMQCGNQQRCLHFRLLLEDPFEQLFGIVKNVDRHGKPALFLIMTDSCLKIIQAKIKVVRRRKSVNNATISYT